MFMFLGGRKKVRKIVYGHEEQDKRGAWSPKGEGEIYLPTDPRYKERAPMVFAHELGHSVYDHSFSTNPYTALLDERDAWKFALSKLPLDEIDLDLLEDSLDTYLVAIKEEYGEGKRLESARKIKNEIMELARKKKLGG